MCKHCTDFLCLKRIKNLLFHKAISELRKNGGSLTGKGSVSAWVRNAGGVPETVRRYFFAFFFVDGIPDKRMKMKRGVFSETGFIAIQDPLFVIQ